MFFPLSKIVWAVLSPLNLVFLVLLGGGAVSLFSRRGRGLVVLGMLLFAAGGIFPVGHHLMARLESRYQAPDPMPARVDGILILGGSFMTDISAARGMVSVNETAERLFEGLALARRYPDAIVLFSGGNGRLGGGERTEAEDAELFLKTLGFPDDNVLFEDRSRNTFENFVYSRQIVLPRDEDTWIVVTSAWHMPRAMAVAQATGWTNVVPYPVDYRTKGGDEAVGWMPRGFDVLGAFSDLQVALHEYVGLAAYYMSGRISLPSG